jgi:Ca2+-binding RTX toxin-like protein
MTFKSQVVLNDPTNAGGSGSDSVLVYDLQQALAQWSKYITGLGNLVVELNIVQTAEGRADGGPTSSVFAGTDSGRTVYEFSSYYEMTTGQHVSGTTSDIIINISPAYFANLDLSRDLNYGEQSASNTYNPVYILMHELLHGFGQVGFYSQSGVLPSGYESTFDKYIQKNPNGTASFVGPNVEAANGGPLTLTTSSTYGENYYHFGNTVSDIYNTPSTVADPLTLDLMNGVVFFYNYQYQVSQLDLGVLKDLGYATPTYLQNGAYALGSSSNFVDLYGLGGINFVGTAGAAGSGTVLVDLKDGEITRGGQLDAYVTGVQGLQLGAEPSVVLGLTSGTDLFYGGAGADQFYNEGAIDYIQGGTGTNAVVGGSGTTIFYGNGGADTMLGGSGQNFFQAGPTPGSSDTFYGNGGTDFIYGGPGSTLVYGGSGTEDFSGGSGSNQLIGSTQAAGFDIFNGGTGSDTFYAGIGTNLLYEGAGTDIFAGNAGTDYIYGGSGRSYIYGGTGTDVITTGAAGQYVKAGSGHTFFNDIAANLTAGRFDQIDNFAGGGGTNLYLPTAAQGSTSFVSQNGGTAVLTAVSGGTAEIFASNTDVATVQAHTYFTL